MIDINWVIENPYQAILKIKALMKAIEPFAEKPTERMDSYYCHFDITTKEECSRCSRAIAAYNALNMYKSIEKEKEGGIMKAQCIIELTDEQIDKLGELQDMAVESDKSGKKGAIVAQVVPSKGMMYCTFWSNDIVMKAWEAIGEDPPH